MLSKWTFWLDYMNITRDRGEWRRVASMNCVRNELMNVILVWLPWLLNSYSQNHRLNERSICEYTCAQRFASITISIHMYIVFPNLLHCNYLISKEYSSSLEFRQRINVLIWSHVNNVKPIIMIFTKLFQTLNIIEIR